jgi:hypothetical protein
MADAVRLGHEVFVERLRAEETKVGILTGANETHLRPTLGSMENRFHERGRFHLRGIFVFLKGIHAPMS